MKLSLRIACAAALIALAATWATANAADAVSFRLNWYLGGLHAPFYYGKERGFYAAEGIDLPTHAGPGPVARGRGRAWAGGCERGRCCGGA